VKITELIATLSEAMREVGDAEVCVCVGDSDITLIGKTVMGLNITLPNDEEGNRVVLHGTPVE